MASATGELALSRLRLPEMTFDVVHRAGFRHQAADTLFRMETTGDDQTPPENVLGLLLVENETKGLYAIEAYHR